VKTARGLEVVPITSGYLSKPEFLKLYHECGGNLHRGSLKSILADDSKRPDFSRISEWDTKLCMLLNHHQIQMQKEHLQLWVIMESDTDGRVRAFNFTSIRPSEPGPNELLEDLTAAVAGMAKPD
jgi:hypothetical protein